MHPRETSLGRPWMPEPFSQPPARQIRNPERVAQDGPLALGIQPHHLHVLMLLPLTGMCGIVVTGDAFNLYVMIEIGALAGYSLLGMGPQPRARLATYNYLLMGTIGASFYLLGVGYLYLHTGELNMQRIQEMLAGNAGASVALVALVLVMLGLSLKMALVPLAGWLPNVYTYAPPLAAAVTAPLVTKVMVYVMVRMILSVFGWHWVFDPLDQRGAIFPDF